MHTSRPEPWAGHTGDSANRWVTRSLGKSQSLGWLWPGQVRTAAVCALPNPSSRGKGHLDPNNVVSCVPKAGSHPSPEPYRPAETEQATGGVGVQLPTMKLSNALTTGAQLFQDHADQTREGRASWSFKPEGRLQCLTSGTWHRKALWVDLWLWCPPRTWETTADQVLPFSGV